MCFYKLLIGAVMTFFCCSCSTGVGSSPAGKGGATVTADPASMTYRSSWSEAGKVTLTDGVFHQPAAPGSAAEFIVQLSQWQTFGVAGEGELGAVILVTQAGGTGSFYDLALLVSDGSSWVNSDIQPLGDRVAIHGLALRDGQIVVDMTTHGPGDPLCCPMLRVERRFAVQEGQLTAAGETAIVPVSAELVGPLWEWVGSQYNDDTTAVPPQSEAYTVQFGADGTVAVRADCNRKGGHYSVDAQRIVIEITRSTRAACPDGSLEDQFVRDLTGGVIWFFKDDDLYIDIQYDTGTMRLKKRPY